MATKKLSSKITPGLLTAYIALAGSLPGIEKKGATLPYTSYNGHMFSFISAEGIVALRLRDEEREAFMKTFKSKLMTAHGTVMKEYVVVPAKLMRSPAVLKKYFKASLSYVSGLKPRK